MLSLLNTFSISCKSIRFQDIKHSFLSSFASPSCRHTKLTGLRRTTEYFTDLVLEELASAEQKQVHREHRRNRDTSRSEASRTP